MYDALRKIILSTGMNEIEAGIYSDVLDLPEKINGNIEFSCMDIEKLVSVFNIHNPVSIFFCTVSSYNRSKNEKGGKKKWSQPVHQNKPLSHIRTVGTT